MFRKALSVFLVPGVIVIGAMAAAIVLLRTAPVPVQGEVADSVTAVRVVTATATDVPLSVRSQGTVQPLVAAALIPEVSGRVTWVSPALVAGGAFKAGDPLVRIDHEDFVLTVQRRRAALVRAQAEEEFSRLELARLRTLVDEQLVSRSNLDTAVRSQRIATANLRDAELALAEAERDLERTRIAAPFDGVVRSETVDPGQFVSRGQSVASLYGSDTVEVRLPVADAQLAFMALPQNGHGELPEDARPAVRLTANFAGRDHSWRGEIVRREAEIDVRTRMAWLVARVGNAAAADGQPPLPVGLFVDAEIEGRVANDVFVLPRAAMRGDGQVLVVDAENLLRFRDVGLLRLDVSEVLIADGLADGERVCVSPLQTAVDGMPVTPVVDEL